MIQKKMGLQSLLNAKPVSVAVVAEPEVEFSYLNLDKGNVAVFQAHEPVPLKDWILDNKSLVDQKYAEEGLLLFRGFDVEGNQDFQETTALLSSQLMDYSEPSTPRSKVSDKVYTSTEYPKEQYIPMHNEHSYSNHWPQKVWFYCAQPAELGGETPICDSRLVYQLIDPAIREEFERKGVMYVRNFNEGLDLPWQQVFQTEDKKQVEAYCRKANIAFEWKPDGSLRTKQVCQATFVHPQTQEKVWFNQAHLFHLSSLDPSVQEFLIEQCGIDNVPRNSCFGDGTYIPDRYLEAIREAYRQTQLIFSWEKSDMLMVDNVLFAHGRNPFSGPRKVMVAMAEPFHAGPFHSQPAASDDTNQQVVAETRKETAQFFINKSSDSQDHQVLKYKLAAAYRIMVTENLDEGGISGHITMRVPGQPDAFWVNPFGLLAEEVTPENLIKVDKTGKVLEGDHPVNVAGFCIHAAIHEAWPHLNCVAHTHSPWGTLFSATGLPIKPIDQNCCLFFENHVLYEQYNGPVNDPDDAQNLAKALAGMDVAVLRNHGTITCGGSIEAAIMRMVAIERAYRLNFLALEHSHLNLVSDDVARLTREWIGNDIGFAIEFNALLRKVEKLYPDFKLFKPDTL